MLLPLTAAYGAVLALFVIALGINVTVHRVKLKVPLGDGGDARMLRMIRLHGNAVEYVPLGILLMLIYELNQGLPLALHVAGFALVLGRALHAFGLWGTSMPNLARASGQTLTWAATAGLAVLNLWQFS